MQSQLSQLVNNSPDYVDNTDGIRKEKPSVPIRDDLRKIDLIRKDFEKMGEVNKAIFTEECASKCSFLYENYRDIFNKAVANELDYGIMTKLLSVLKLIEDGKVDQNNGSVMVGQILKELYIDSALKRADNMAANNTAEEVPQYAEAKNISWKEYKSTK